MTVQWMEAYHRTPDLSAVAGVRAVAGQETDLRAGNDAVLSSRGGVGAARDKTTLVEGDGGVLVEGERRESLVTYPLEIHLGML